MNGQHRHSSNSNGYLPLPDCVTIKKSKLHGLGLFATKDIPAGFDLGISHVADERFPSGWIRTPLGGFLNHSPNPNATSTKNKGVYHFVTRRAIRAGEELTDNYSEYGWYSQDVLDSFNQG
jgi:SET domain-containing protein